MPFLFIVQGELPAVRPAAGRALPASQYAEGPAEGNSQGKLVFRSCEYI